MADDGLDMEQLEDLLDHELLESGDEGDSHQSEEMPTLILGRSRLVPIKRQSRKILKRKQEAPTNLRQWRARSAEAAGQLPL